MKYYLLLPIILLLTGCEYENIKQEGTIAHTPLYAIEQINIEGCQYFIYDRSITHKGNCTNHIHRDHSVMMEN